MHQFAMMLLLLSFALCAFTETTVDIDQILRSTYRPIFQGGDFDTLESAKSYNAASSMHNKFIDSLLNSSNQNLKTLFAYKHLLEVKSSLLAEIADQSENSEATRAQRQKDLVALEAKIGAVHKLFNKNN